MQVNSMYKDNVNALSVMMRLVYDVRCMLVGCGRGIGCIGRGV